MSSIHVDVTVEHIAAGGRGRMEWARPVELAIAAATGVPADIDGGDGEGVCVATIGGRTERAVLVIDLPPDASAWLDRNWLGESVEPFAFDIELPDWLADLIVDQAIS
jgi:hypothetical protein